MKFVSTKETEQHTIGFGFPVLGLMVYFRAKYQCHALYIYISQLQKMIQ